MLLSDLDMAFEALMTGADTNPQTLATALTAYSNTLYTTSTSFAPVNTTISSLNTVIVSHASVQTKTGPAGLPEKHSMMTILKACVGCCVQDAATDLCWAQPLL